ncbi:MAG TPA: hypothetical protein VNU95_07015 [Candidatus Acidoferrales bacterium]|jgi:hypothetical protein|nr:hypothetical protein [Candidatus Acidoferrales bacterium]
MVSVKIECECGQNYAFEVEPINGRMPSTIACPACGADGTVAANEFIAQQLAPAAAEAANNPVSPRLATARPTAPAGDFRRGLLDLDKAEKEARAKIMWGESLEQVIAYLTIQGLSRPEATDLATKIFQERTSIVRSNGIKKIFVGLALMAVPVLAYFLFRSARRFPIRLSVICYGIGIFGGYLFVSGILNIIAPKSEQGAVEKE